MENTFFDFFQEQHSLGLRLDHSDSTQDWTLQVSDKGAALPRNPILRVQGHDRSLVFAKAYVELCEYLNVNRGGY